jgi:hypothetical protein
VRRRPGGALPGSLPCTGDIALHACSRLPHKGGTIRPSVGWPYDRPTEPGRRCAPQDPAFLACAICRCPTGSRSARGLFPPSPRQERLGKVLADQPASPPATVWPGRPGDRPPFTRRGKSVPSSGRRRFRPGLPRPASGPYVRQTGGNPVWRGQATQHRRRLRGADRGSRRPWGRCGKPADRQAHRARRGPSCGVVRNNPDGSVEGAVRLDGDPDRTAVVDVPLAEEARHRAVP